MDKLILAFCRLGFAGLSPIMPGTCGSALAAVLAPFLFIPLPFVARVVVLVLVFWIGGVAATRGEQILGYKDPGEIVIDELLGMIEGMDVVDEIANGYVDYEDRPQEEQVMKKVTVETFGEEYPEPEKL